VRADKAATTIAYLRAREQVTMVYREMRLRAALADGRVVDALSYVVDRTHAQYAGALTLPELERFVGQGVGISGPNPDYVRQTYAHMGEIGIDDPVLAALTRRGWRGLRGALPLQGLAPTFDGEERDRREQGQDLRRSRNRGRARRYPALVLRGGRAAAPL
jgi:hypothetical protein